MQNGLTSAGQSQQADDHRRQIGFIRRAATAPEGGRFATPRAVPPNTEIPGYYNPK
jgi:hypothetical protein